MPGKLRLYTDEDISWRLAAALSSRGFDVLSCHVATQWALAGREHAGIIVAPHMGFARLIERTLEHLHFYDADAHYNVLIHLH